MKIDHLSFSETVERLAALAGMTLRYEEGGYNPSGQRGERTRLVEAHQIAANFYVEQLAGAKAEIGRKFLAERGFDQAAAAALRGRLQPGRLGPSHPPPARQGFHRQGVAALRSLPGRQARTIDRFRGRLIWPIRISPARWWDSGPPAAGRRQRPKTSTPPRPRSTRSPRCCTALIWRSRRSPKASRAVVVEGYTDVMACHLAGVTTAIATCGTAFGGDHIKILRRLLMDNGSARAIFTFDGDAAGQKAALRAFEDDQKFAAADLYRHRPRQYGPCELRLAKGDEAVQDLVEPRTPLFEFAIRQIVARYDLETTGGTCRRAATKPRRLSPGSERILTARGGGPTGRHPRHPRHPVRRQTGQPDGPLGQGPRNARGSGAGRPAGPVARDRATRCLRVGPGTAVRRSGRGPSGPASTSGPPTAPSVSCSNSPCNGPSSASPAFDAYGADEFTAPPYAAVRSAIEEAGGAEQGLGSAPVSPGSGGGSQRRRAGHGHRARGGGPARQHRRGVRR